MASMLAARPIKKKTSKVDPIPEHETELNDLGPPPSSSDLRELFETYVERPGKNTPYIIIGPW